MCLLLCIAVLAARRVSKKVCGGGGGGDDKMPMAKLLLVLLHFSRIPPFFLHIYIDFVDDGMWPFFGICIALEMLDRG